MSFPYSVVLIAPQALRADSNLVACAMGFDVLPGNTFGRELSASATAPPTHYGCHTWAEQNLIDMLGAFGQTGNLPAFDWTVGGLTEARAKAAIAAMFTRVQVQGEPGINWTAALTEHNLQMIPQPALPGSRR